MIYIFQYLNPYFETFYLQFKINHVNLSIINLIELINKSLYNKI